MSTEGKSFSELSAEHKEVIYVIGALDELRRRGVIVGEGIGYEIHPDKRAEYEQMLEEGFSMPQSRMASLMVATGMVEDFQSASMMCAFWRSLVVVEKVIAECGLAV